ncbi:MAG TPA: AAA family ATPase [Puia sp.]|jgi:hypothetical protein|nr:AAA family ATPase [Puia sp.]
MERRWIHPNTITGDAATKERYLRREHINEHFWREVRKGNHILFVAPRRVGKTSIMRDLAENCPPGFAGIYQNIEGVKSKKEFYQRLFTLILQCIERSKVKKATVFVTDLFKRYSIKKISTAGLEFESSEPDYEKAIRDVIPELKKAELHTVIFLDEFAEVIHKLNKQGKAEDAIDILHMLREMRSISDCKHFTLVYAGSIGLEFVIKNIDRPKLINDLHRIIAAPLTDREASELIRQLTKGATIRISEDVLTYIKKKIDYLLPYYLQLMLEEIDSVAYENDQPVITIVMVETAFQRVLSKRNNFEDWLERLKAYQSAFFSFINDILKHTAHKGTIATAEIHDKAIGFNRTDDYMDFVEQLIYDGYLVETGHLRYRFISPLLQQFWLTKYPVYESTPAILKS